MKHAPHPLQRLRYWQGQTLKSDDFKDEAARQAALRWWHNRAIHGAWGRDSGLVPFVDQEAVRVTAGLAYDCHGRELVLTRPARIQPPPAKPEVTWALIVQAGKASSGSAASPVLSWERMREPFDPRRGVPLAAARFEDGKLILSEIPVAPTPAVRAPRLGNGATVHGKTDWRPWARRDLRNPVAGLEVAIDTSAAGFESTPCYFAWLVGNPARRVQRGLLFVSLPRVTRETPTGFVFSLWLPFTPRLTDLSAVSTFAFVIPSRNEGIEIFARRELSVCWLGVECASSALKAPALRRLDSGEVLAGGFHSGEPI
jgi:hypothetical protein